MPYRPAGPIAGRLGQELCLTFARVLARPAFPVKVGPFVPA